MKYAIIALGMLAAGTTAGAQGTCNLQGKEFRVDTVAHYYIGPGITYTALQLTNASRTVKAFATTLDKTDPSYSDIAAPRVVLGKDMCQSTETVSSMAKRNTTADRQVLAGVNGDFFITSSFANNHPLGNAILGYPNMSCAIDGKLAAPDMIDIVSRENALIIGSDGMWIDATDLTYKLLDNTGDKQVKATAVNYPRLDNELMIYNSYNGSSTRTSAGGRELVLRMADGAKWAINSSVKFIVDGEWSTAGNTAIPADGIVISCGKDYSNAFIDGLANGDVVKLKIILSLPAFEGIKPDIQHVVGGDVRILKEGVVTTEAIRWINTPSSQYSRSLTGYSQDRNRLVMAVTDAGGGSTGLTYYESADLMAYLGCYDALDFDGGGSTELWMAHTGPVNNLRDGGERAVGNALYFTIDAPADKTVASIRFADAARHLPVFGAYRPVIYGYNKYGQLVDTDVKGAVFSAPEGMIQLIDGGILAAVAGTYPLTATVGSMTATIAVDVDGGSNINPRRADITIDASHTYSPVLESSTTAGTVEVANEAFTWTSDDENIASVSAQGVISAVANGSTTIHARRGDIDVPVAVTCHTAPAKTVPVDLNFGGDGWKVSASGTSGFTLDATGENAWDMAFTVTSARAPRININGTVNAPGLPSAVSIDVDPHGSVLPSMAVSIKPYGARQATYITSAEISAAGTVTFPLSELFDVTDPESYPIQLVTFQTNTPTGVSTSHKVSISNFNFVYDAYAGVESVAADQAYTHLPLMIEQGSVSTTLPAAAIEVYSLDGRLVAAAEGNTVATDGLEGLYIVKALVAGKTLTAKAILR
ncbi:MAG: phosphodiester glycosidase family protein [Muribaculaceae bacterium]|nr:phosphodiester glycosidase family protein [Muribaculaceae bacterium]